MGKQDIFERKNNILTNRKLFESVQEFIRAVQEVFKVWDSTEVWFRGVSKSKYKLIPTANRPGVREYHYKYDGGACADFTRNARQYIPHAHSFTRWQWHFLMQHYGLPTRLLDWTEGSLIGLYFAVRKPEEADEPIVWILDPFWFNALHYPEETERPEEREYIYETEPTRQKTIDKNIEELYLKNEKDLPTYPAAIVPVHIDSRIQAQRSVFTIHGSERKGIEDIADKYGNAHLAKRRIKTSACASIIVNLNSMGISEEVLFPDLEGLARSIKLKWYSGKLPKQDRNSNHR